MNTESVSSGRAALAAQEEGDAMRDAERYRWLRETCDTVRGWVCIRLDRGDSIECFSPEELDAAIDEEMSAPQPVASASPAE